jgi:folate-binding protein YgfZ
MPTAAASVEEQYAAMRERAGMLERDDRGHLEVSGPDAAEFLQGQVTNDVLALEPGTGCYAAMLTPKGRIVADMRILRRSATELWIDTPGEALEQVSRDLRMYKIGRQVEIADRSSERTTLSLIGPAARALAGEALGAGVLLPDLGEHAFSETGAASRTVLAVATDLGIDLIGAPETLEETARVLADAGAEPVSPAAAEIARIESGRPRLGFDMSEENLPGEAGIVSRAVSFTKGCYVGQEPVARMYHRGHPNRHLRGLRLTAPAERSVPLLAGEREVGRVTSVAQSPRLGPIALAMIRREVVPGDQVRLGAEGPPADVVELPFG